MSTSPDESTSRSQTSLSPSNSQSHSESHPDVSLQTLVSHLLASKRSLSSIDTVWRANEIVTAARAALEESVILGARTDFLRNGISGQVKILKKVRGGVEGVYKDGQRDFKNVIRTLDAANSRLEETMDVLRSTMVEAAFRPEEEEPRNLLDFVDEQGVENMRDALKESIRETREAQTDFDSSILSFDDDLRALKVSMTSSPSKPSSSQSEIDISSPLPEHLHTLENHAQEMANLLSSLVTHFDLCVNAIRNTEGGYAAALKAASSQPPGSDPVSVSGVMKAEGESTHAEPITEEERKEMLDVLEKDASQVDDVVMELREFLAEMEVRHLAINDHVSSLNTTYQETLAAYNILEAVGSRLPTYISAAQDFRSRYSETKLQIQEQLTELESMRLFYENYHASYDSMIIEVFRRKQSEEKIKGIMKKALEQVEKVYQADVRAREEFRLDAGEYLPVDLYAGVNSKAREWEFVIKGEGDEMASLPVLETVVVEAASRRERERERADR